MLVVGYVAALGVLIDLDHFLIARWNAGTWRATRNVLRNPGIVLFDQEAIFTDDEVGPVERLVSHTIITVCLVGGLLAVDPYLAGVSAVALIGHICSDIVWGFTSLLGPARART